MNEFEGKSKNDLEKLIVGLKSYKTACIDSYDFIKKFIKNLNERTIKFYDAKINDCQNEINKHE